MSLQIAQTIAEQLQLNSVDGFPFFLVVNVPRMVASEKTLTLKLGRKYKVTDVVITLDEGLDLYNIEFFNCRNFEAKSLEKIDGVYFDQMGQKIYDTIRKVEGLA